MKRTRLDRTRSKGGMEVRLETATRTDEFIVWSNHVGQENRLALKTRKQGDSNRVAKH
jgi:hypothetical protein